MRPAASLGIVATCKRNKRHGLEGLEGRQGDRTSAVAANPHSPCMKDGKRNKNSPKTLNDITVPSVSGHPIYRRRAGEQAEARSFQMDDCFVVL